jgi:hypothetical protein
MRFGFLLLHFFFAFTLGAVAHAGAFASFEENQAMDILKLKPACDHFNATGCKQKNPTLETALNFCDIRKNVHKCDDLAKAHPELSDSIISCDAKKFCEQQAGSPLNESRKCLAGLYDGITDVFIVAGKAIGKSWEETQKDVQKRTLAAKACDLSLQCKRNLVKDMPGYNSLSDKQLMAYPAFALMTEAAYARPKKTSYTFMSSAEVQSKMLDLWRMAGMQVEEKYHQYSCYTPEALAELRCYVFGQFVDPTVVGGKLLKLSKARRIVAAMMNDGKSLLASGFIRKNLYYSPTKTAENVEWITLAAKTEPGTGVKFFDVENSVMKDLNDTLKDKNLVTSLTNYHKRLLSEKTEALMKELHAKYPDLQVLSYSDFKASRFAFKGRGPPDLEKRLGEILEQTNHEFADTVRRENLVAGSAKPEEWFRGGFGESADQATLASRYSRGQEQNSLQSFASSELQKSLASGMQKTEGLRNKLSSELGHTGLMDNETLHADAFDIIIKNGDDIGKAQAALKNRFGLSQLSTESVQRMRNYVTSVNSFSPGIHIGEREIANLDAATFGGLSADMAGMGSQNQRATAMALAGSRNLEEALKKTRQAEQAVTAQFLAQQKAFREIMTDVVGANRIKTICSGDDCVAIPLQALSEREKQQMLEKLSGAGYASKFRLSFVGQEVSAPAIRNQLSVHGESVEKLLRKNLSSKMDPNKLKGIIFGVDMKTGKLNEGPVKLLTASHPDVRLTKADQKLIEEEFYRALLQMKSGYYPAH